MNLTFYRNLSVSGLRNILFFGVFVALLLFSQDVVLGDDSFEGTATFHRQALSGLRNGKGFTVNNTPVQDGIVTIIFEATEVKSKRYRAEVVREGGFTEPLEQLPINLFTGKVVREDGFSSANDFAKLSFSYPGNLVEGLMRVNGVFYDLSSMAQNQNIDLVVKEIPLEDLNALFSGCGTSLWEELGPLMESAETDDTSGSSTPQVSSDATTLQEIELGTEATASFVAIFGSAAEANSKIISIINAVNGIYETDLGLTNKISIQRALTSTGTYTEGDSSILLSQFRNEWNSNVAQVYDVAHLFSGVNNFEGSVVGRAYLSVVCGSYRYGVSAYYSKNDSLLKVVVAHEEGHNLGAGHSTTGGIMSAGVSSSLTNFASESISVIETYINSINCLSNIASGNPPVLDPVGQQVATEGNTLQLSLTGSDPDGDPVTYSATPLPAGATMAQDGAFTYTPPNDTAGCGVSTQKNIQFSIVDSDGNSDSEWVTITINDNPVTDNPPVLNNPGDKTVQENQLLSFTLVANDDDGDTVTFSSTDLPPGASLSETTGQFMWTPSQGQAGNHSVTFIATECGTVGGPSQTITITVGEVVVPQLTSLFPIEGAKDETVTIDGAYLSGSTVTVYFGNKQAPISSIADGSIIVKAPRQSKRTAAKVSVKVVRDGMTSNSLDFTYTSGSKPGGGKGRNK